MADGNARKYINPYKMQWWLQVQDDDGTWGDWVRVTEVNKADNQAEPAEYAAAYLDYEAQPKTVLRLDESVEFEVDMLAPGEALAVLAPLEAKVGVTARACRTLAADPVTGSAAAETALIAKMAEGQLFVSPFINDDPEKPMRLPFKWSRSKPWAIGTFNATDKAFAEATKPAEGSQQ